MGLSILPGGAAPAPPAAPILGIDLGTTFSLAAYMTKAGPRMIRDETGDARVPSVVGFAADGSVTIGKDARRRAVSDPGHTVYSIKRLIGRTLAELAAELPFVPYQVVEREREGGRKVLCVRIDDHEHTPEELSALVLRELVRRASQALGEKIERAVVTVPAYFDESQRQATRDAGRIAGLDVVRIVNEPTAAALAYGLAERTQGKIAVYDFGGGTFDCSVLALEGGVFKVLSTHGDTHLGGDDVDLALFRAVEPELPARLRESPNVRQMLRDASESLKIALSERDVADLEIVEPALGLELRRRFRREELEALIGPLVDRTIASCRAALRDAELEPRDIDEVVLVGGSSRIPLVRRRVEEFFGRRPHCELNPDEVVAMGAAVQASILQGQLRQILLLDITPLSLGIETMGGAVSRLVPRNSTIPAQATEMFTTFVDNQTGVDIHVVQGERELARDCRSLGKFRLTGIPPMPAGLPRIEVKFLIDANGMLQVTARETRSGAEAGIEIQPSHGLSREEVETMIRESIETAKEDFAVRRLVELKVKAESNLGHTEKGLRQAGEKLSGEERERIGSAAAAVRAAVGGNDADELQRALDRLDEAATPLARALMDAVLQSEVVGKKLSET